MCLLSVKPSGIHRANFLSNSDIRDYSKKKNRLFLSILIVLILGGYQAIAQQKKWTARPATYSLKVEKNVPVTVSDGTQLLVDIYTPADSIDKVAGKTFPVLLTQNPYTFMLAGPHISYIDFYTKRGYICVIMHVRGTNGSGGNVRLLSEREQKDGVDLVNWVAHSLKGSNGTVGLYGTSWLGFTQVMTAARLGKNSPVKAMVPTYMGAYFNRELTPGGIPSQSIYFPHDFDTLLGGEEPTRFGKEMFENWKNGGDISTDGTFWREREPAYVVDKIVESGIPALFVCGWQDLYPTGISELYAMIQNAVAKKNPWSLMKPDQSASNRYPIVMGPWAHYKGLNVEMTLAWYDKWLLGKDNELFSTSKPYHAYDITTGKWFDFVSYPFTDKYTSWYFDPKGKIQTAGVSSPGSVSLSYGPRTQPGTSLIWKTEPFQKPTVFAGPGAVKLFASSSTQNMALLVELYDVSPSGERVRFSQGTILGSARSLDNARNWTSNGMLIRPFLTLNNELPVKADEVYELDFPLAPRLVTIPAGHHLEVSVSTQPLEADCQGHLGIFPCFPAPRHLAQLNNGVFRLHFSSKYPSRLYLPLSEAIRLTPSQISYDSTPNHPF